MIVRFEPSVEAAARGAVLEALEGMDAEFQDVEELLILGRVLTEEEAVRIGAMPGVAAITPADPGTLTIRENLLRWMTGTCLVVGILILAAANLPAELGAPADPLRTPEGLLPAWPVLAWYSLIDLAPRVFPVPLFILAGALLILAWPFLARRLAERMPAVHTGLGILALLAGIGLAILGLRK